MNEESYDVSEVVAGFTDQSGSGGDDDSLVGGNFNGDSYVDIVDFAFFVSRFTDNYGDGNTDCDDVGPHIDAGGNGSVFTEDFTFIQSNFFIIDEGDCRGLNPGGDGPRDSITLEELEEMGLRSLFAADLTDDGVVDVLDIEAFLAGERPRRKPQLPQTGSDSVPVTRIDP